MSGLRLLGSCISLIVILSPRIGDDRTPNQKNIRLYLKSMDVPFDRYSLRAARQAGDKVVIALTQSGHLALFEAPRMALRKVRKEIDKPVVCLGRGSKGAVLAGLADGRVCRVDPKTLDLVVIAKVPAFPEWIETPEGREDDKLWAVVRYLDYKSPHGDRPELIDLGKARTHELQNYPTAFLLDQRGDLWLGSDYGEWGGWCERYTLATGSSVSIPKNADRQKWTGVLGFVEFADGQVWAFGGTSHMGFNQSSISRVDRGAPLPLAGFDNNSAMKTRFHGKKPPTEPARPRMPITHMLKDKDGEGLFVFSFKDIFYVNRRLTGWKKVGETHLLYRFGRPDAVGAYPAVLSVFRIGDELVLATRRDGLVRLRERKKLWEVVPDPTRPPPPPKEPRKAGGAFE